MKTHNEIFWSNAPKNKKLISVLLSAMMILSAFVILTVAAAPASAASGTVSFDPSVFSNGQSTLVVANGGTFSAGSTVYFYVSSSDSFGSSSAQVGSYSLGSGNTTLINAVTHMTISETPGTYYLAASDDNRATFTSGFPITVTSLSPSISIGSSTAAAGGTAVVAGSQFDPGSTVNIYLQYAGGPIVATNVVASTGYFAATVNIPTSLSQFSSTYYLVAQEVSTSSLNFGITASASFTIQPSVSVSPLDVSPSLASTVVINGYGFYPGATVAANSVTLSSSSGSITGASNSASTVGLNGQVSVTETFASSNSNGPVTLTISTSPASSLSSFSNAFYVSQQNATNLKFTFSVTPTTGSTYNVGDTFVSTVYNFPAAQTVKVYLGSTVVETMTTDSNGFAQGTSLIPAMPGGTYYPTAEISSMGLYEQSASLVLSPDFTVSNPGNVMIASSPTEFVPSTALFTVSAYGLSPSSTYNVDDSLAASSGVYSQTNNLVTSVAVGSEGTSALVPASNGTLILTYSPGYSTTTTGTTSSITMTGSVNSYKGYSFGYRTIGEPTISSPTVFGSILTQGATGTNLVVTGLIPFESPVYPGISYYYSAYMGPTSLSLTYNAIVSSTFYASGGSFSGSFTVPYLLGVLDLNITYSGAVFSSSIATQYVVISVLGTSYSSGTLQVVPLSTPGTYEVVGYGYYLKNPTLYYTTYSGPTQVGTQSLTNGAFAKQISPGSNLPAGSYSVFTELSYSGTTYFVYSSYSVSANLTLSAYSGSTGSTVTIKAASTGLITTAYYNVYFGTTNVLTDTGANIQSGTDSFKVPTVLAGTYRITVVPVGQTSAVESAGFTVTSNSNLVLATDSNYAFPGQLVQFTVSGMGTPSFPSGFTAGSSPTYSVTVDLNGTPYETVSAFLVASGELSGSFLMPNSNPGSYYLITLWANESASGTYTIATSTSSTGYATLTESFPNSQSDYLGLVSGNGALITGISQSQIAQLETDINTTLSVPISQLDASVTSITNSVAQITTSFGTMEASLNSISATVTSIDSGVATLETTLGTVKTSLSSLNSTIVALNGDTAKISTAVGVFNTTINNINATVTISNGNLATIKTDLGTFTGNVTSVSNGIATIQTNLGTIKTYTQATSTTGMVFILEIVILVLAVIAVAFSAVAMMNTRKKF